jgi:uncharacterized protein YdcH (DUF465 family)
MQHQAINTDSTGLDQLLAEHRALDERVGELERRTYLSAAEQLEVLQLKKMKLHKKDQIQGVRCRCDS